MFKTGDKIEVKVVDMLGLTTRVGRVSKYFPGNEHVGPGYWVVFTGSEQGFYLMHEIVM